MNWSVWWYCPIHCEWELDAEHLEWEDAQKASVQISLMTGQPAIAVCEDDIDV